MLVPIPPTPHQSLRLHTPNQGNPAQIKHRHSIYRAWNWTILSKRKKRQHRHSEQEPQKRKGLPLRPLLVQHTVTTVLAADLVATLERDAGRALAAEVNDRGTVDVHGAAVSALGVEGGLRAHRGDLVRFARHRWWVCWVA